MKRFLGSETEKLTEEKNWLRVTQMFEEIKCMIAGHDLEKTSDDREEGPLPGFKCRRCGRKINKF